jgi:CRISPR/Cas system-associated exonuclease Cas4 (RecB family)
MRSLQALKSNTVKIKQPVVDDSPTGSQLEEILVEKIDINLGNRNKKEYRKVEYFRPSNTNQCSRYWYYVFNGIEDYPTQFSPQTYRIFDNGHAVHDRLYSYLREMGILVEEELPVSYDDPPIQGTADGVIDLYGHKLIELKSISAEGFEYRRLAHKPSDDHYRQAQIYMQCLNLDSGFVIYENKNNQQILPIYIERDHKFIDKLFNKYRKIYKSVQEGVIPDRPYKRTSKHCASCDLETHCWADFSEAKSIGEDQPF